MLTGPPWERFVLTTGILPEFILRGPQGYLIICGKPSGKIWQIINHIPVLSAKREGRILSLHIKAPILMWWLQRYCEALLNTRARNVPRLQERIYLPISLKK